MNTTTDTIPDEGIPEVETASSEPTTFNGEISGPQTAEAPPAPPAKPAAVSAPESDDGVYYFQKALLNMPFYINRVQVKFEPLDRNTGVLKISASDPVADALLAASLAKRGGIIMIDEAGYLELKKKLPYKPLDLRSLRPKLQILQTEAPRKAKPAGAPAAAAVSPFLGRASGVGPARGGGTGEGAGTPSPVPAPSPAPPGEFQPSLGKKKVIMPVLRKPTGNSLSGGSPEPQPRG